MRLLLGWFRLQALRNSMLRTGVFTNEKVAEEQVVSVLNFDVHLVKDFRGNRYIERITECIPVNDVNDYDYTEDKKEGLEGKFDRFEKNATKFFAKETNKELYRISDRNMQQMVINMDDADSLGFRKFVFDKWGIKLNDRGERIN